MFNKNHCKDTTEKIRHTNPENISGDDGRKK